MVNKMVSKVQDLKLSSLNDLKSNPICWSLGLRIPGSAAAFIVGSSEVSSIGIV